MASPPLVITAEQVQDALSSWVDEMPPDLASKLPALAQGLADLGTDSDAAARLEEVSQVGIISEGILKLLAQSEKKDKVIHKMRLDAAVTAALADYHAALDHEAKLTREADEVLRLERVAIDRLRAAERALRKAVEADKDAHRKHADAVEQAARVVERNAAVEVHQRAQTEADAASEAKRDADRAVIEVHEVSQRAKESMLAARGHAAEPGRAPRTAASIWLLGALMLQFGCELSDAEMDVVSGYTVQLAERCDAARIIEGRERARVKDELTRTARGPGEMARGSLAKAPRRGTLTPIGSA
jgi:hypothetical protein